jgi:hypothetical protein
MDAVFHQNGGKGQSANEWRFCLCNSATTPTRRSSTSNEPATCTANGRFQDSQIWSTRVAVTPYRIGCGPMMRIPDALRYDYLLSD